MVYPFNNFLSNCDMYGYVPMLWDCSTLFIRRDLGFFDNDVAGLFKNRSFSAQSTMTQGDVVANAKAAIDTAFAKASENVEDPAVLDAAASDKAIAWIMFNSSDWGTMYSVGVIQPYW